MKVFMIAGTNSGIGKTTISLALMSILENVSPFKVGPDYIDTSFHEKITGNKSYNLDLFMMGEIGVKYSFLKHHKDISIIEGVMGLYDGIDNSLENNSSAHLSRVLDIPVILVVDAIGKSTSIAAQVLGYINFDKRVRIEGVIINNVSSEKTYKILKEAIEKFTGVKCLGYLMKNSGIELLSRHLGLVLPGEVNKLKEKINLTKELISKTIDIETLLNIAEKNNINENILKENEKFLRNYKNIFKGKKVSVAKDEAFSFYYNDNLELLELMGMEISYFSPINDKKIPDANLIYFGGGYPELHLEELSSNLSIIEDLKSKIKNGTKVYAECGGFMYLTKFLTDTNNKKYEMAGIIPCSIVMTKKLDIGRFGYINILDEKSNLIGRGHEFHYSKIENIFDDKREYRAMKKDGREWKCIFKEKNIYAGYPHLHFYSCIEFIKNMIES